MLKYHVLNARASALIFANWARAIENKMRTPAQHILKQIVGWGVEVASCKMALLYYCAFLLRRPHPALHPALRGQSVSVRRDGCG